MARSGNAYYQGPASDHFDGTVFFNPGKPWTKGPADMLKWQFSREGKEDWPSAYPSPFTAKPAERVGGNRLVLTHVGHASVLLQTGGLNILVDPVWSERASPVTFAGPKRVNAPGIPFEDLPPIDVVLVTHNHYDHLDTATLGRLSQAFRPRIVTPLGNDTIMRQGGVEGAEAHDWGARVALRIAWRCTWRKSTTGRRGGFSTAGMPCGRPSSSRRRPASSTTSATPASAPARCSAACGRSMAGRNSPSSPSAPTSRAGS